MNKMNKDYITICKDKNGEWDFRVSGLMAEVSKDEINELRSIIITAIYIAEDMWRRGQEKLPENKAYQENN